MLAGTLEQARPPDSLLEAVARIGLRLMSIRSHRRLLADCAALLRNTFDLDSVALYLLDDDKQHLVLHTATGEPGDRLSLDESSLAGRAFRQQIAIHSSTGLPFCELALPLTFENSLGVLMLGLKQTAPAPDKIAAFQILADQVAAALYNTQRYTRDAQILASAERRAMLLEAATQVGRDVVSILELDTLLERMVDTICLAYGFYYAAVFLVDTKMKRWAVLRAGYGEAGRKMLESGHLLEITDNSIVGWCINHKQARIALDVGPDTVRFDNPLLPLTRSEMALPLVVGNDVIGALCVQSAQEAAFEEKDINTLQVMADQLAIALHNAELLSNLRETHRELVRTKTFEAIATATGEAIHWVGNKAAPIPACVKRTRDDVARLIYMADAILCQAPQELRQHLFAQIIADAAETLDEKLPGGRELLAGLESKPLKSVRRLLSMESILEDLDIVNLSAQTILNIKEDLIGPARQKQARRIQLDELLKNIVASMAISPEVYVEQRYAPALPAVVGDPRQLENVFGNLLKNAVEAMFNRPEKRLTLETALSQTEGWVEIRITDTGCGIAQADLDRIWITFYTTKGDRGGTGLGLSACMQIVSQMEGKIKVESKVNVGTTFTVSLPAEAKG